MISCTWVAFLKVKENNTFPLPTSWLVYSFSGFRQKLIMTLWKSEMGQLTHHH